MRIFALITKAHREKQLVCLFRFQTKDDRIGAFHGRGNHTIVDVSLVRSMPFFHCRHKHEHNSRTMYFTCTTTIHHDEREDKELNCFVTALSTFIIIWLDGAVWDALT